MNARLYLYSVWFVLVGTLSSAWADQQPYTLTWLGFSSSPRESVANGGVVGLGMAATSLDDTGKVAGYYPDYVRQTSNYNTNRMTFAPVFWNNGAISTLPQLGGRVSIGSPVLGNFGWVTAAGEISFLGNYGFGTAFKFHRFAVCANLNSGRIFYLNGISPSQAISELPAGPLTQEYQDGIEPYSVNASGTVVGMLSSGKGFIWSEIPGMRELSGTPRRINDAGFIFGTLTGGEGVIWNSDGLVVRQFAVGEVPLDMNSFGVIVGQRLPPPAQPNVTPPLQPFVIHGIQGAIELLALLEGADGGSVRRINDSGDILGECDFPNGDFTATLWRSTGEVVQLSHLLSPVPVWTRSRAIDLNDAGEILVNYPATGGSDYALLRPPGAVETQLYRLRPEAFSTAPTNPISGPLALPADWQKSRENLVPLTNSDQPGASGLVADGVTPLLIRIRRPDDPGMSGSLEFSYQIRGGLLRGSLDQNLFRVREKGSWKNAADRGGRIFFDAEGENANEKQAWLAVQPIAAEDVVFELGSHALEVAVTVYRPSARQVFTFQIRKPPVVLVHGYNANSLSWGIEWKSALADDVGDDFVALLDYGVLYDSTTGTDNWINTYASLPELARLLRVEVEAARARWQQSWAVTRFDAVGHSQGGVLLRMNCGDSSAPAPLRFRSASDCYRGVFRRVVTVGSPHAGSRFVHYLRSLRNKNPEVFSSLGLFTGVIEDLVQEKFDPFAPRSQIAAIGPVDSEARFHLVATTVDEGRAPGVAFSPKTPGVFIATLLAFDGRGKVVFPNGSDGIVDLESQLALNGLTKFTTHFRDHDISHASDDFGKMVIPPLGTYSVFGVSLPTSAQTQDALLASHVAALMAGPGDKFGKFPKVTLPNGGAATIDAVVPELRLGLRLLVLGQPGSGGIAASSSAPSSSSAISMTPAVGEPLATGPFWSAERITSTERAAVPVLPNTDPLVASVELPEASGDIYLRGSYRSASGKLVVSPPVRLFSDGTGAGTEIRAVPGNLDLGVGQSSQVQFWRRSSNGLWIPVTVTPDDSFAISSSDPATVFADPATHTVKVLKGGSATITMSWQGLTTQFTVGTTGPLAIDFQINVRALQTVRVDLPALDPNGRPVRYQVKGIPWKGWLSTPGTSRVFADGQPYTTEDLRYMRVPVTNQLIDEPGPQAYSSLYYTATPGAEGEDSFEYALVVDGRVYGSGHIHFDVENTLPTISITSPQSGKRLSQDTVTVTGTASDNQNAHTVQFSLNGAAWEDATLKLAPGENPFDITLRPRSWSAAVTLEPGPNIVRFRAQDNAGNWSRIYSLPLTFVQLGALQVAVEPASAGRVPAGYLGTSQREHGTALSLTASPAAGFIFNKWTGSIESLESPLRLVMRPGLSLTAHFIPNPFPAVAGNYHGIILPRGEIGFGGGSLRLLLSSRGTFSGKLLLGAYSIPIAGVFNSAGSAWVALTDPRLPVQELRLQINLASPEHSLVAYLGGGSASLVTSFAASRATYDSLKAVSPASGKYTLLFRPEDGGGDLRGSGIATGTITARGDVTISGRLPDNSIFSATTFLSRTGEASYFLHRPGGSTLLSTLQLPRGTDENAVEGTFVWRRKPATSEAFMEFDYTVLGSRYVRPALFADLLPPVTAALGGILAPETGEGSSLPVMQFVFSRTGRATFATATPGLQLSTDLNTGLFNGTFRFPQSTVSVSFYGAFIPDAGVGEGFYRATPTKPSGTLRLLPPP